MLHRAEIVKAVLEDSGLMPVVVNKQDSLYNNFGNYEVLVKTDEVLKAMKIITDDILFE
ncbi:hypothetical protein [Peijinzhouia sedimentorum]